jgi:hypothetical protein
MSAAPKTIEGTWNEILRHAPELEGRLLRVTILDESQNPDQHPAFDTSPAALQAWLTRFHEHADNRPVYGIWDDSRDAIYNEQLDHQI